MRRLPAGTVTCVFTDVEGSTKVLNELGPERYAQALAEHRRALREAFARHGGVEVDTQGDAFFFAFARASDAVAAADAGQRAVEGTPVRVRMGVHTGEPILTEEGYVGPDVHLAARVATAGHGGQVVMSEATARLLNAKLRDLGEHRLKDIKRPVRLFQLGEGGFPPLKTLNNSNLPLPATPLLGREKELANVLRLLRAEGTRLVTVTGPGGIGKTRFALEVAHELVEEFAHGVWFADLSALRDPALVVPTIASTLGANGKLAEHVADKQLLLLLDSFEQVVDAATEVADLLRRCTNVQLLITSREPLHVAGEWGYPLRPLAESPAVELFRDRAEAADPGFRAPPETLTALVDRLDRLPLAIELAAARVRTLSPPQLAERLEHRLALLKSRARDVPERQRTLRAAIEWSYELLPPHEQHCFRRLSVFAGGFDIEAAERVGEADLEALESLVEKSLVQRQGDRFTMLETIREFAAEGLDDDRRQRHANYFAGLAARLASVHAAEAEATFDRLAEDVDNLRAAHTYLIDVEPIRALRLALDTDAFWNIRGGLREGLSWLELGLSRAVTAEPALRARALEEASHASFLLGDEERSRGLLVEALPLAQDSDDGALIADVLMGLGRYEEALDRFRALGDEKGVAHALHSLGSQALETGDLARARRLLERALELARRVGRPGHAPGVAHSLADCALEQGRLADAATLYREVLEAGARLQSPWIVVYALGGTAALAAERSDDEVAARLWSAVRKLEVDLGQSLGRTERRRYERRLGRLKSVGDLDEDDAVQFARAYLA